MENFEWDSRKYYIVSTISYLADKQSNTNCNEQLEVVKNSVAKLRFEIPYSKTIIQQYSFGHPVSKFWK